MSEHMTRALGHMPTLKKSINPTANISLEVYEQRVYAVPQGSDFTITFPDAHACEGLGPFLVTSDGAAAGDVICAFPLTTPNLADLTLTADEDFIVVEAIGGAWHNLVSVIT